MARAKSCACPHVSNGLHGMGQCRAACGCRRCRETSIVLIQHKDSLTPLVRIPDPISDQAIFVLTQTILIR